ncbi:MAG TPA: hypothetical protein VN174_02640 [Candidatus Methanoperedens sp.]|nr:hypothetical protein [Candidatus Methanoperedens sp.]
MKNNIIIKLLIFTILISGFTLIHPQNVNSIPSKNVKDVLSSSQFSYYGGVGVGTSADDSILNIDTSTSFPSQTTNNLFVGDTISVGIGGSQSTYIVRDIGSTSTIFLNVGISADAITPGGSIIATRSAVHTVSFEPQVNAAGGIWQVLIKSTSGLASENSSDGIPDQRGFDLGTLTASDVICPWGATASVGTTTAATLGSNTAYYHVIQCALGAGVTNPVGTGETGTIVIGVGNSLMINPSPSNTPDLEGNANIFSFVLRHWNSSGVIIEQTPGKIAVVESVRVTATIDPTLTFIIDNIGVTDPSSEGCGIGTTLNATAVYTTGDKVVFGSLELNAHNQLAQRLSCVTNAASGYVVTAYEAETMKNINTATTLPDTTCNGGGCTPETAAPWTTISGSRSEFGYTMTSLGASIPFVPGDFKPFGIGFTNAQPVMINPDTPLAMESAYTCYRISIINVQEAGDYEAKIVYTATATF